MWQTVEIPGDVYNCCMVLHNIHISIVSMEHESNKNQPMNRFNRFCENV